MNLVRRAFPLLAVLTGLWLVWILQPLDIQDGVILFVVGLLAGDAIGQLNPREPAEQGPDIPWDDMGAGERFGYFLPALGMVVVGSILLMMAIQGSRVSIAWQMITASMVFILAGIGIGLSQWSRRNG